MAYILTTIALWTIFMLLVPVKKWRSFYPVIIFAALLGTVSDLLGVVFDQWAYYGPVVGALSLWSDLGIAPAEGVLFIQLFPIKKSKYIRMLYLGLWSLANAALEWFFVWVGWIGYDHWNPLKAFCFYLFFFGLIWAQEYWYNGTGKFTREIKET